jgi:uncharacterized protein
METTTEMAERTTILRAQVGSTLYGLNIEGKSDIDEMGICVEPIKHVVGLNRFQQVVKTNPDLTIYGLEKFIRLALGGNPTILQLLFVSPSKCSVFKYRAAELQELAPKIISKRAGRAFLGYLTQQRKRLIGETGQKNVNREELVKQHGFDTKYAMHMLRLGYQGIELLTTGGMQLPIAEPERSLLMDVRNGVLSLGECMKLAAGLEKRLETLLTASHLPDKPAEEAVEEWMINTYYQSWKAADV